MTHAICEPPPRSPMIDGRAVTSTMVSSALRKFPTSRPTKTNVICLGVSAGPRVNTRATVRANIAVDMTDQRAWLSFDRFPRLRRRRHGLAVAPDLPDTDAERLAGAIAGLLGERERTTQRA